MTIPSSIATSTIKRLLVEAQPYIAQHGFKIEAIRAAISSGRVMNERGIPIEEEQIQSHFSSNSDLTKQLLSVFDQEGLKASLNSLQSSSGSFQQTQKGHEQVEDQKRIEKVELLLAGKLLQSAPFRDQLVDALAILTAGADRSIIPGLSMPLPVLRRAWSVTEEAIYLSGWKGRLQTDWYTHRTRLTNAFMLSELHLLSPDFSGDVHQSLHVLRKLARSNKLIGSETMKNTSQWIDWGAKGWLGIFRSLGL